jgi:hypothetical protein
MAKIGGEMAKGELGKGEMGINPFILIGGWPICLGDWQLRIGVGCAGDFFVPGEW